MDMMEGKDIPNSVEYEIKVKNGTTKWVVLTASYKRDENNIPIGARVIALDITDKKMAQLESQYKEQMIYNELEQRLMSWRRDLTLNREIQVQKLKDMNVKIMSINNGME